MAGDPLARQGVTEALSSTRQTLTIPDLAELMQRKTVLPDRAYGRLLAFTSWSTLAFVAPGLVAAESWLLPAPLVHLRDVDPTIRQDIRYATPNNLTGAALPGYEAAACILTRETAAALRRVQAELAPRGLSLKVYDCYRPERAVRAFVRWTREAGEQTSRSPQYHPNVRRSALVSQGYLAYTSRHSWGDTVDLTLVKLPEAKLDTVTSGTGDCTAPADKRAPDTSVDMGTGFDCLDPKSATLSTSISPEQRQWRLTLVAAMRKHGFHNYAREWWHFTYGSGDGTSYDVPITARP